jgi:hypothetical protein
MSKLTTKPDSMQPATEMAVDLFDNWFDPIETAVRARARQFIEELIRGELDRLIRGGFFLTGPKTRTKHAGLLSHVQPYGFAQVYSAGTRSLSGADWHLLPIDGDSDCQSLCCSDAVGAQKRPTVRSLHPPQS